ncbi:CopG family ribbon-helix-helix protein [Reyranella sp. CPCC 100927]|uniref:CopG family ribbon-helix-helix protein n=1 Tax=Reyranella sp. CPCC 100927 TaxID=2599616 RepID=UPI0011B5ACE6|nr:ribbon-helix-helix protein, CopG family [Reyranella sp. CPCC 100927]TWT04103.1 ribbon-helix-helix protein, CopG family [Reyranella sp. CPCC 100927]
MPDSSVTLNLSDEDRERLARLAAETGRSEGAIAAEALHAYLDVQSWQLREIRRGLAEADAGDFASPEEVEAMFRKCR